LVLDLNRYELNFNKLIESVKQGEAFLLLVTVSSRVIEINAKMYNY